MEGSLSLFVLALRPAGLRFKSRRHRIPLLNSYICIGRIISESEIFTPHVGDFQMKDSTIVLGPHSCVHLLIVSLSSEGDMIWVESWPMESTRNSLIDQLIRGCVPANMSSLYDILSGSAYVRTTNNFVRTVRCNGQANMSREPTDTDLQWLTDLADKIWNHI